MPRMALRYPLLAVALLLAVFTAAHLAYAERPDTCSLEDREIPGNTNSVCVWDFGASEITTVEYRIAQDTDGNSCYEQLAFKPFDAATDVPAIDSFVIYVNTSTSGDGLRLSDLRNDPYSQAAIVSRLSAAGELVIHPGTPLYDLNSALPANSPMFIRSLRYFSIDHSDLSLVALDVYTPNARAANNKTDWLNMPVNVSDFNLLMNDCLADIKRRLETEAKLEETRQNVEAERVAQERASKQADADAEQQRLETEAAREALRLVQETELAKTQALIEQLAQEKIIIGIWQEVVVEKQKGAEARAQITYQYLTEIETNAAEFKASVVAKAEEIRRLQEINTAITEAIIAHNDEVERQLAIQQAREAEQREKLDDLHIEPSESDSPVLTPTATP